MHRKMHHANNENWETTHDGRNGTTKSTKHKNAQRKGNLQLLGNIGSWHDQTSWDEKKKLKKEENEKPTRNKNI